MPQSLPSITAAEYLATERTAETKSEYFNGEIFAMAGASLQHNQIVANVIREVGNKLLDGPCQVFASDLRLKVSATGLYTYPDATIVCSEQEFDDDQFDTLLNPAVIVEVLPESTESYDRGVKFAHYRRLKSLQEYVLISQDRHLVEVFARTQDDRWLLSEANDSADSIAIPSVGVELKLSELYRNVKFSQSNQESIEL